MASRLCHSLTVRRTLGPRQFSSIFIIHPQGTPGFPTWGCRCPRTMPGMVQNGWQRALDCEWPWPSHCRAVGSALELLGSEAGWREGLPWGAMNTENSPGFRRPPVDWAQEQSGPKRKHAHAGVPWAPESSLTPVERGAIPSLTLNSGCQQTALSPSSGSG